MTLNSKEYDDLAKAIDTPNTTVTVSTVSLAKLMSDINALREQQSSCIAYASFCRAAVTLVTMFLTAIVGFAFLAFLLKAVWIWWVKF